MGSYGSTRVDPNRALRSIQAARKQEPERSEWRRPLITRHRGAELLVKQHKTFACATAVLKDIQGHGGRYSGSAHANCAQLTMRLAHLGTPIRFAESLPAAEMGDQASGEGVHFVPAGMPIFASSDDLQYMRYVALQFDTHQALMMGAEAVNPLALVTPRLTFVDSRLLALAKLIEAELTSNCPTNPLYGDSIFLAMLVALSDAYDGPKPSKERGSLALWQVRRATEYIQERLRERIELAELANTVGLSQAYFCRAFKISTGLAPHQWQLEARIKRAKRLLLDSRDPIAGIAVDVGFADQAHFTRAFTRTVGTTPAAWRRAHRA